MSKNSLDFEAGTLAELLAFRAASSPDALAFAEGGEQWTYRELEREAESLAAGLAGLGVGQGDRVALVLPAGLAFVRCFWALQRLGAVSCALNPFTPVATSVRRAARIRPLLLLHAGQEGLALEADGAGLRAIRVADVPSAGPSLPPVNADPESLAFLQPTSGTSGESRAVMIRHRNVLAVLRAWATRFSVGASDVLVSWVPPWHDLGLVRFMIGTVYTGSSCHIIAPSIQTIPLWLETVTRVRATITGAPDFAYRLAASLANPDKVDLSSTRWMTNGGEPVRLSTIHQFEQRFRRPGIILPGYGLAEATLGVSSAEAGAPIRTDARGNVSCGRLLPGVEVRIEGEPTGEILVRGPGVFAGYFDAEEATAETLRDGWLHTGDIGHLDEQGELFILGRSRAMLKRGGAVIAPRELEEAALGVEGVRLAAAVGIVRVADATEEIIVAIEIDPKITDSEPIAAAVAREIRRVIGFAPERVMVLPSRSIPRTFNGKVRHDALREALMSGAL